MAEPDSFFSFNVLRHQMTGDQGPVSRRSRELFGPEKLVVKLQSTRFEKLIFLHAFNIRKIKRIAKFEGLELRRCEDIKGIVVPNIGPKSFGTFEKQAPVAFTVTYFATLLWYNHVAELRQREWFVKCPSKAAFVMIFSSHWFIVMSHFSSRVGQSTQIKCVITYFFRHVRQILFMQLDWATFFIS